MALIRSTPLLSPYFLGGRVGVKEGQNDSWDLPDLSSSGICTVSPVGLRSTLHTSQSEISGNLSKSCHHSIPKFSNFLSQPHDVSRLYKRITPPKFNSSPLKNDGWNTSLSCWKGNFSGAFPVKLREGYHLIFHLNLPTPSALRCRIPSLPLTFKPKHRARAARMKGQSPSRRLAKIQGEATILTQGIWEFPYHGCWPKNRGWKPPKWMVKIMENPIF